MQSSLFDTIVPKAKNSLIISSKKQQPLNKQQQAFNRLVKKIEKLRMELEKTSANLDEKLNYYGKYIAPLEQQLTIRREEVTKLLFPFYSNKKLLLKPQKKTLKDFLSIQLKEIFANKNGKPDEELQKIFKAVYEVSYEEAAIREFEEIKDQMEGMFEGFGFDMDFSDFSKDMTAEEMMAKMKGLEDDFLKQEENRGSKKASRKKTDKQLQREERERQLEEARNKNISSIYKQLAQALHPDLDQDEDVKMEKEVLMKRLTVAYDKQDLHSMLSLEMEWIHKEEQNTDKLSNEKLAIYNQVLKEQVEDIEQQLFALTQHPRFHPLMRYNNGFPFGGISVNLQKEKRDLEDVLETLKRSIANLKGKEALREVRNIINIARVRTIKDGMVEEFMNWE